MPRYFFHLAGSALATSKGKSSQTMKAPDRKRWWWLANWPEAGASQRTPALWWPTLKARSSMKSRWAAD